jgi:hypothetical protein
LIHTLSRDNILERDWSGQMFEISILCVIAIAIGILRESGTRSMVGVAFRVGNFGHTSTRKITLRAPVDCQPQLIAWER